MKGGYLRLIRAMGSWVITGTSDKLDYKRMDMGVNPSVENFGSSWFKQFLVRSYV